VRIEIKGRQTEVSDEMREYVEKRFAGIAKQVSELATLEVELHEERNPAIADKEVAEARLHLKGATLIAREASPDMMRSIKLAAKDMQRQVKRHREKRRRRPESRRWVSRLRGREV
jgi:ribosome hibernation promoting factor